MIRTCGDFVMSVPGRWVLCAMLRYEPEDFTRDTTWSDFANDAFYARDHFTNHKDKYVNIKAWVDHVRYGFGVWSSGEKALALAVLHVIDYDWLADELTTVWNDLTQSYEGRAFQILSGASGEFAEAIAACFARVDR